jgi:hypothetical protein
MATENQQSFGALIGPDGAGILHVTATNIGVTRNPWTGGGTDIIHEGSAYDGIYVCTGDAQLEEKYAAQGSAPNWLAHLPLRIAQAEIGPDVVAVEEVAADATPDRFELGDAYPNPFNAQTTIEFSIPEEGHALLTVFNSQGQRMRTLVSEFLPAGFYRTYWDGNNASGQVVAGGMYFYRLRVGDHVQTKKMTLLK